MLDLAITRCRRVEHDGIFECDIGISNGRVVEITERGRLSSSKDTIDAGGRYVLPGVVDTHSHIGLLPGANLPRPQTLEENLLSESLSALYGGTTSVIDFVISQGSMVAAVKEQQLLAKQYSKVNTYFHGALMNDLHISEIEAVIQLGVRSFKIFLPYRGEEALRLGGLSSLNDGQLMESFKRLHLYGGLPIIHAENPELIDYHMKLNFDASKQDMTAWESTRPGIVEGIAIEKVIYLAKKIGCSLCIAHVSSKEGVEAIRKEKGRVLLETTPHYLTLTKEAGLGALGKVSPPIRSKSDQDSLWEYIDEGFPVVIGSDHNPWQKQHKLDMWEGSAGLPGNSYVLPLLISEGVYKRNITWEKVVEISSYNAAKQFGLFPRKGTLNIGADADLVIVDEDFGQKVDPAKIPSIVDYSPYFDYVFPAWPAVVLRSGIRCNINDSE